LAALLVDAGRVVPVDTLIDRVWGPVAPEQARATLRTHLSRIRRLLEQDGGPAEAGLSRVSGGYLLRVDPGQVDLHRFRQLAGDDNSVESLRSALTLWRGEPLAGIDGEWAGRMREVWCRERVDVAIAWARAELARGNPRPVLAGLAELASDNPLVEPITEVLMRAFHAAGRTSEALELYARTRAHLAEELGTDPGPELRRLHQCLLRGEAETGPALVAEARLGPRQLPAPPQLFTGRVMELAELDKIHDASTVVITAIDGMAGVGKTALAVQAAHQMADRYPDGQLFIDLHGYTDGVAPVEAGDALDRLLRSLGVPGESIPADLDQRAGLYRSQLAERRMVIVLDNAASEAQVRPLLPGAPGCVVLVTSRRRLAGLDYTHTMSMDTLLLADAVALLRHSAGDARLAGQPPDLVEELVELCGRLPLAIRIASARLHSHAAWDLAHLVQRLRDEQHRLVELQAGPRSVAAALDLSYQALGADQQRTYRRLGLHPGPDIDPYAAAALLDATLLEAGVELEHLLEAHLLQEPTPGRYRFHDLTRAHAAHVAAHHERDAHVALDRLLDFYRSTAAVAMAAAYPYERHDRRLVAPAPTPGPGLSEPTMALTWLESELPNLLAAARYATDNHRPEHVLHLSTSLQRYLRTRGAYHDAETLHRHALSIARATGAQAAEAEALVGLGHIERLQSRHDQAIDQYQQVLRLAGGTGLEAAALDALVGLGDTYRTQGRPEQAIDHYQQALRLGRAADHQAAQLDALAGLGHVHTTQGRYQLAIDHYQQALRLARATGHQAIQLQALTGLGNIHRMQGRDELATDHYQQSQRLARATGNRFAEQAALIGLALTLGLQGRYEQATDHYERALQLARATGYRTGELNALAGLGLVESMQGWNARAADHYERLLELADQVGSLNYQFEALQGLGRVQVATGDSAAALSHHNRALALAIELDQPDDQARAYDGLAHAHHVLHQTEAARTHWQHALDILTRLGIDHSYGDTTAAAVRTHLANLDCLQRTDGQAGG
jgi:tetratricopeptide (TPR) repeat protein/DNA-binding SARP family transcriptional activator